MTLTTSGNRSTAARPRTRPATTSRPARAGESRPAAGGAPGARALGFEPGQTVERKPYDLLFGQRKSPDGSQLGRPPGNGRKAADLYAALLAAEPHATAERKRELRTEAVKKARQSPLFFDLTLSLSKSISILHASLGENARLARQVGDREGDKYWSGLVGEVDDMIWQAVYAGFACFQREAGYTRTGSHNTRVRGRETGQWHEADLAVAHWLQHTSRDGDMQLHVHSQIAHVAKTTTDGKWRAPDSLGYNEHIGAVAAIVSQHLEEALTHRFGLEWTARDDGHRFEIKGISGEMMRLFSSRRESITADLRGRAARFKQRYGRTPSQRELAQLAQASNFKTRNPKHGALDLAQAHAGWADKLTRTLDVPLASIAPSVWHEAGRATARGTPSPGPVLTDAELARAAQKAVALAQQEKSAWTRADVIKHLGRVLPRSGMDPAAAAALLEDLTDRVLASQFEPVVCLEAPELAEVPASLRRADGRSIYQRHGGTRYATRAQLAMEERMLTQARASTAPKLVREQAAHALGADLTRLEGALTGAAPGMHARPTETGLREDQAAAALAALTGGRLVSVINAPAGSGKTRVLAEAARIWAEAGLGPVIGITPSQSARNTLAAGVPVSYNAAQFLGHLPGRRGARGPVPIGPGTLSRRRRGLDAVRPGPGRPDRLRPGPRRQDHPDRGRQPAAGRGERRRHVPAHRPARLRPAGRTRPVPQPLGTTSQPAAARWRHLGPGRVRPARPHPRRRPGADDGRRRSCLHCPVRRWHRHPPHGRRPRAAARAEPPHPRRAHRPRHRQRRTRRPHR
jgi:hypothetical protein